MIEIIGTPRLESEKTIKQVADNCLKKFKIDNNKIVEILFVDQRKMRELNFTHRKINKPTDVLSFPQNEGPKNNKQILGSIVICEEIVSDLGKDAAGLIQHGFLHLLGYDHETNINSWDEAESKFE